MRDEDNYKLNFAPFIGCSRLRFGFHGSRPQPEPEQKETSFRTKTADHGTMPEGHKEHHHPDTGPHLPHEQRKPYWQRAHKDWKFWVGVAFLIAAIAIYVLTLDLSTVPRLPH
jgi:hypothetical protein